MASILIISVFIQLSASVLALRLIRLTGKRTAWILIAVAIFLMSIRRILTLGHLIYGEPPYSTPDPLTEIVALISSSLIFLGVLFIKPLFLSIKQAQAALKESEEKYRNIVETSQEGIWVFDAQGKTVYVNRRMEEMLGFKEEKQVNLHFLDLIEKEVFSDLENKPENRKQGVVSVSETRLIKKDGSALYTIVSISPLIDGAGNFVGTLKMFTDITQRKIVELALQQKEELVRKVLETLPVGVSIAEKQGQIVHVNPAGLKIWGGAKYVGIENYGEYKGWLLKTGKRIEPQDWAVARAVNKGETTLNEEVEIECFDGARKIILNSAVPLRDAQQEVVGAIIVNQDITERKKLEDALQQERDRMINILNSMGDGIYIANENCDIIYVNPVFEKEFGPIGKKCYEYFHGLKEKCPFCKNREVFEGKTVRWEWFFQKSQKTYDILDTPLKNQDGSVLNLGIYRDVTERKQAEEILKRDKESFEKLVSQKTEELVAIKSQLEKEKQLSSIGTLAATVAHELRNPLGVIRTAAYNVKRKDPNPAIEANLANIDKKVLEADQIINNLLFYSRIKMPHYETVNIYDILDECVNIAINKFHKYKVTLAREYKAIKGLLVETDSLQLKEVFSNLLNNAYESLAENKGEIEISASYDSLVNEVNFSFKDSGVGMSPQELERISEPFFTTKSRGTGLGLTVCFQIINLHGGKICVASEKGKGTTFTIALPAKKLIQDNP